MEIMWEMSSASGCDRYKATVTDDNVSGRVNRGRGSGRESTSIGGNMVCGSSIKIPVVLRRLLKMDRLKLGCQSLLIPASGVEAGGRRAHRWIWGWDTPLTGPLTRRPSDEGVRGLGWPSRRRAGRTARPRPHMNGACPRVVIAGPKAASS